MEQPTRARTETATLTDPLAPLFAAIAAGNVAGVDAFLDSAQLTADVRSKQGLTALHAACEKGDIAIVSSLLHRGAAVDARVLTTSSSKAAGATALHIAAERGHDKIVAKLLASSASANETQASTGRTALHFAALGRGALFVRDAQDDAAPAAICRALLQAGANCALLDGSGRTALHYAAAMRTGDCCEVIADGINSVDALLCRERLGYTALHYAVAGTPPVAAAQLQAEVQRLTAVVAVLHRAAVG